ncbi:MAG: hypothetical protein U0992_01895 [Planctomycetaceae bacterium]
MRRTFAQLLLGTLVLADFGRSAGAQDADAKLRTDVLDTIRRAQEFLINRQSAGGIWDSNAYAEYPLGPTALAVQALLNSGLPPEHRAVSRGLQVLRDQPAPSSTSMNWRPASWSARRRRAAGRRRPHWHDGGTTERLQLKEAPGTVDEAPGVWQPSQGRRLVG